MALPHGAVAGLQCVIVVFPDHTRLLFGRKDPSFLVGPNKCSNGSSLLHDTLHCILEQDILSSA